MEDFCKLVVVKIGVYLLGFIFKIVMKICQINEVKRAVSLLWCIILGWGPELGPRAGGLGRAVKGALAVLLVHPATIFRGCLLWAPLLTLALGLALTVSSVSSTASAAPASTSSSTTLTLSDCSDFLGRDGSYRCSSSTRLH